MPPSVSEEGPMLHGSLWRVSENLKNAHGLPFVSLVLEVTF